MKHAYLILAHNAFELLALLIESLDDAHNDLFIHLDRKVPASELPQLQTAHAGLYLLPEAQRVDVRWGDVSVLEAEFALFRYARGTGSYSYYHLMSGVDLPLKPQAEIQRFFREHQGREFIGFYQGPDLEASLRRKVRRYHLFPRSFRPGGGLWSSAKRILRALALRLQEAIGLERHRDLSFAKGTQWMSITEALVEALIQNERAILALYHHSFCPDEIAIQTFVRHSPFWHCVYDQRDEGRSSLRHIGWRGGVLYDFTQGDYEELKASPSLFARKFNTADMPFLLRIRELSR